MPPRLNEEGCYTDEDTVDQDGKLRPYTALEIERTRAYEEANGIPSTLEGVPLEDAPVAVAAAEAAEGDDQDPLGDEAENA